MRHSMTPPQWTANPLYLTTSRFTRATRAIAVTNGINLSGRSGSGQSWDECLGLSSTSTPGQLSSRSALAGQPDWTIEQWVDDQWVPVETTDGYWIEIGDGTIPVLTPRVRTLDESGAVQDCPLSNFVLGG